MEEKGLVIRETSADDKRVSFISLTDSGKLASNKLLNQSIDTITELIKRVGEDRIEDFLDTIYVLKDILECKEEL